MPLMMGDWIRGTRAMRANVKGVYIGLLIHQYDHGYIPEDLETIALIEPEVGSVWDMLSDKFPIAEPGKRKNPKLEEVRAFWSKQAGNGSKGGRPKKQNPNNNPNNNPKQNPKQNPNHNHHNDIDYDIDTVVLGNKESPYCFKIKRTYLTDKNYIVYGEDGYIEMITKVEGLPESTIDRAMLKKFLRAKNGVIFDGSPSYVINSFKHFIEKQFK